MSRFIWLVLLSVCLPGVFLPAAGLAQEEAKEQAAATQDVVLAEGGLLLKAPGSWKKVQPKITMIEAEFAIPKLEADEANGRVTMMASGGSIEQNIERWYGQFELGKEPAEPVVKEFNKVKVHLVDLQGTYLDTMGNPAGPKSKKENYRMLAAIIETPEGNYYVKCYGPAATMEKNVAAFNQMIESVRVVQ
ncbi:MAG: hypothetical protein ACK48X_13095 [Planctomycetota bacterium]